MNEQPTATVKNISIIKVENGYVVSSLGISHIAKDTEEVKQHISDRLPYIMIALDAKPDPVPATNPVKE